MFSNVEFIAVFLGAFDALVGRISGLHYIIPLLLKLLTILGYHELVVLMLISLRTEISEENFTNSHKIYDSIS